MQSRLLLNVVIRKGAAVLELLPGEDQTLLVAEGVAVLELEDESEESDRTSGGLGIVRAASISCVFKVINDVLRC